MLRQSDITFRAALSDGAAVGVAAQRGELKSMHVLESRRGAGVAAGLVAVVIDAARQREYRRLHLQTGTAPVYAPARRHYERFGFAICPPFGDDVEDPHSMYLALDLSAVAGTGGGRPQSNRSPRMSSMPPSRRRPRRRRSPSYSSS